MSCYCACKGLGLYITIWTLEVARGIHEFHRFVVPCGHCNLAAYSAWIIKHQHRLAALHPYLVAQVTFASS